MVSHKGWNTSKKANIDTLMKEGARTIILNSALPKIQEKKDVLDKVLKQ